MKKIFTLFGMMGFFLTFPLLRIYAQVAINADNSIPDNSAMLDVSSTTKGALLPRMTFGQRNAIGNPVDGLMVFCTNCSANGALSIYSNGAWRSFAPCNTPSPTEGSHILLPGEITWMWTEVPDALGYKWNTTESYESAIDIGDYLAQTETGISCGNTYTRYVWAYFECGVSMPVVLSQSISAFGPASPTSGTLTASINTIFWNWNTVNGATSYRWNTTDDFATAEDMETQTTKTESGLTCNTTYTRYVWASNECGYSTPLTLNKTTTSCSLVCATSITINHLVSGGVAPVNKSVTYGIITNLPGEPALCWITRNLGASQQPTTVNDNTEASAGWFWQFNRKQGYKHDGTTRTPNTTWIATINENSDWTAANDPCTIEFGAGWRIPTNTEWTNVDETGGWTTYTGAYNSPLKLHCGGYLEGTNGVLGGRGNYGYYRSSTQFTNLNGWLFVINSENCNMGANPKTHGFSLRCIRFF